MQRSISLVLLTTFMASLVLSMVAVVLDPVINNDAVWYLSVAKLFAQGEYVQAIRADVAYEWPFYAFVIGSFSHISGLSVDAAAYILNALFLAIAVTTFVAVAYELGGGDRRIALIAAVVFLLLPGLNTYRSFVIRDFGYLAGYAVGLFALLKYSNTPYYRYALLWGIAMLLAVLFRSEGVVFLLLAPLYLLFREKPFSKSNWQVYFKANTVVLVIMLGAVMVLGYLMLSNEHARLSGLIVRHVDKTLLVFSSANELLGQYAGKLGQALLHHYNHGELKFISLVIILTILMMEFVTSLSLPYLALWLVALRKRWFAALPAGFGLWRTFIWLNLALLAIFVFASLFLVGRYMLALLLTFMLCVPFLLLRFYSDVWKSGISATARLGVVLLCVLFVYNVLNTFITTGPSRDYEKEAGLWLKQVMQPGDKLLSATTIIAYYADTIDLLEYKDAPRRASEEIRNYSLADMKQVLKQAPPAAKYNFVALRIRPRKNEVIGDIENIEQLQYLKEFENNKGDQIVIYRVGS